MDFLDRNEPVQPRKIPVSSPPIVLPWLVALMTIALIASLTILAIVWMSIDDQPARIANPSEYFLTNYASGLSQAYAESAVKARNGEFRDFKSWDEFFHPIKEDVHAQSSAKVAEVLSSLNGEGWDNERAAQVFETLSKGPVSYTHLTLPTIYSV